jgi:hypothetical protein
VFARVTRWDKKEKSKAEEALDPALVRARQWDVNIHLNLQCTVHTAAAAGVAAFASHTGHPLSTAYTCRSEAASAQDGTQRPVCRTVATTYAAWFALGVPLVCLSISCALVHVYEVHDVSA